MEQDDFNQLMNKVLTAVVNEDQERLDEILAEELAKDGHAYDNIIGPLLGGRGITYGMLTLVSL